jgi:predicted RNA-binding Zn-ribbon protein involved in translation (DUF1610 family)
MTTPCPADLEGIPAPARPAAIFRARGCARCDGTGYRGRVGIYELLVVDARVRELIMQRAPTDSIRDAARAAGMRTLGQDAWERVREGVTSLEEVRPLLALLADEAPGCAGCGADIRADFVACPRCGVVLRERCECGRWLEEGWNCCAGCGAARVTGAE